MLHETCNSQSIVAQTKKTPKRRAEEMTVTLALSVIAEANI